MHIEHPPQSFRASTLSSEARSVNSLLGRVAADPPASRSAGGPAVDVPPVAPALRRRLQDSIVRRSVNPPRLDPDVVSLFYSIDRMRSSDAPYVLQFVSSAAGAGTSTVAREFCRAASMEYRKPVLLLHCDAGEGPSVTQALASGGDVLDAMTVLPDMPWMYTARLASGTNPLLSLDSQDLRDVLGLLKQRFTAVVLDCAAAAAESDSLALSRFCDGSVIVVRAEHGRREAVRWTRDAVEQFGGTVVGAVLNRRRKYLPAWLYRWV
jgi:protein-tyrosine kinase